MANSYQCSDGTRVKKSVIDARVHEAKRQKLDNMMDEQGYIACEDCGKSNGEPLDCSHDISVDKAQKEGKSELAWDVTNITIRCRTCHRKWDKTV